MAEKAAMHDPVVVATLRVLLFREHLSAVVLKEVYAGHVDAMRAVGAVLSLIRHL